jgi:hypothetical protein
MNQAEALKELQSNEQQAKQFNMVAAFMNEAVRNNMPVFVKLVQFDVLKGRTADGAFYLCRPKEDDDRFSRVISNQVRFGYGYRTLRGKRQYYAWHGYPNRNDDFITYAEIDEREFERITVEYPSEIEADRETAEQFRTKYVDGHPLIKEGWNVSM